MTTLAFIDCETTGLDPTVHEIWEVALILHETVDGPRGATRETPADREFVWQLPVDLSRADPGSLSIGKFYERRYGVESFDGVEGSPTGRDRVDMDAMTYWADFFCRLTSGAVVVGANPGFDVRRLDTLLRFHGAAPAWHYRPIDVEALAYGFLRGMREIRDRILQVNDTLAGRITHDVGQPLHALVGEPKIPWVSSTVASDLGLVTRDYDRHTALGDCRWALAQWKRIMEPLPEPTKRRA